MSADREEIRWEFEMVLEMTNNAVKLQEDTRKEIEETILLVSSEFKEIRNTLLAGVGFAIGLVISLIAIGILSKDYSWLVIIGIVIAIPIYVGINVFIVREAGKSFKIADEIRQSELVFTELKGLILGMAVNESTRKEQVLSIGEFIGLLLQAFGYKIDLLNYQIYKTLKPDNKKYAKAFEVAKSKLVSYENLGLNNQLRIIESFIKDFELNSK